jgi:Xaa-Pro aminopeptidase
MPVNPFIEKVVLLRTKMKEKNINAYIIPSTDPHLGEYIPDHWRITAWLTGFTGSFAFVVITDSFAGLWTDSRYFIQAAYQMIGSGITLMDPEIPEAKDFLTWVSNNMDNSSKLALDGRIFSIERTRKIVDSLLAKNISCDFDCDLISDIWTDRPVMPFTKAYDHELRFCGMSRSTKIAEVRKIMRTLGVDYHLLTSTDDIMWLLNIRGNDVKYSPLLTSYAIVGDNQILLFSDESKIPYILAAEFDKLGIVILPYEETAGLLSTLPDDSAILLNPLTTSFNLYNSIPLEMKVIEDMSIPTRLKAIKNKTEIKNIGSVMIRDGVALTRFFHWLEQQFRMKPLSELILEEKLNSLRAENENFLGPSFSSIVAYNDHGALPHYSATTESDYKIGTKGVLLVDSGGQYLDGTTDITRTITIGTPDKQQICDFTLVLKGNIALAMAKFPAGTKGSQLDILARKALWDNGLNYGHGTGHGVGFCLNVHEGPQNIGPGSGVESRTVIEAGMLISDEPAIYREGQYGIRTENLLICYEDEDTDFGKFLKFDTVSLCYIDKSLIDISLLDQREIDWLNSYHCEVYEKLSPYLSEEEKSWLEDKTSNI